MVKGGLLLNFLNAPLSVSFVAARPRVTTEAELAAAVRTPSVASMLKVPAGQEEEKPFATVACDCQVTVPGWLFHVVAAEIGLVAYRSTAFAVQEPVHVSFRLKVAAEMYVPATAVVDRSMVK